MSPMFIGGLTARAIKLKDAFTDQGRISIEAYPKAFVERLNYKRLYQKKNLSTLEDFMSHLQMDYKEYQFPSVSNWHQVDAILAFLIATKYENGIHSEAGDPNEGLIIY